MAKIYNEADIDKKHLDGKVIAVIGYGSQGRAHALNLRDSGCNVIIGLRPEGKSKSKAEADGFKVHNPEIAAASADIICMLAPDMAQPEIYKNAVEPNVKKGATILFAHGFCIHYQQIKPNDNVNIVMVAPKGPGNLVRRQYEQGNGVPCLVAVSQDTTGKALQIALAYSSAIGGAKAGVFETTFAEETETDLFGEQAVLCGGATELVVAGYETLVEAGYSPTAAYFECLHELKLIADLLYEGGIKKMQDFVSDTAKYGDLTRGPRVIDEHVRNNMRTILKEIQSGQFATEWVLENQANCPSYKAMLKKDRSHPIEEVGAEIRKRMAWLEK